MRPETYLGDGVYVSFDGYQLWLRTSRDGRDEMIALEPPVWQRLLSYVTTVEEATP